MNLTTKQKKALKRLKIRPFEKDLRRFSLKEIKRELEPFLEKGEGKRAIRGRRGEEGR